MAYNQFHNPLLNDAELFNPTHIPMSLVTDYLDLGNLNNIILHIKNSETNGNVRNYRP